MRGDRGNLIAILQEVQARFGYLPEAAMQSVARFINVPESQVYGVATFYSQFRLTPTGKKMIRVCQGTACRVQGGARILEEVKRRLGIAPGGTTSDGTFTLETVACPGTCALAPNMTINGEVHSHLTPEKVAEILAEAAKKV